MLTKERITALFKILNNHLEELDIKGELYLVGGAVMCLALDARPSTNDIDAYFKPTAEIREASRKIAAAEGLEDGWLNDAVKGFLSEKGSFDVFLELPNLTVLVAQPEYLLAMKCLAMRLGAEFQDERDIRFLLRYLNIENYQQALSTITEYYPLERFPQKTIYALEELLELPK